MSTGDDEVPGRYILERVREVQTTLDQLDQKIEDKLGDYAVRLAKLELRQDQSDKAIELAIAGRRWRVETWVSLVAILVAIVAVVAPLLGGH
jgi:t-SNARE complex subunit (syntaxin)